MSDDWFRYSQPLFFIANQETLRILKSKLNSRPFAQRNCRVPGTLNAYVWTSCKVSRMLFLNWTQIVSQLKHPDLCIVDSMERGPCDFFSLLETLTLYKLNNLERICIDPLKVVFG